MVRSLLGRALGPKDPVLRVRALGLEFPGPLGLAAGFDKDARAPDALGALGFGFVEVGTLTAKAQPGNPKPRLFRLPADRALVNRMGFNNSGVSAAARRLAARRGNDLIVGVNIGKTKATGQADVVADYAASAHGLAGIADYLVINVSSPNTPGLRDLQALPALRSLIEAVREAMNPAVPLLVKIAPDQANEDIDAIADLAMELGLDGIIAANTSVSRADLASDPAVVSAAGAGGLSGPPLRKRGLEVIQRLYARTGGKLTLVATGGIESADDAWERITAGATLLEGYTGFIYGGPLWPYRLHKGLASRAHCEGFGSIQDAVGTGHRSPESLDT